MMTCWAFWRKVTIDRTSFQSLHLDMLNILTKGNNEWDHGDSKYLKCAGWNIHFLVFWKCSLPSTVNLDLYNCMIHSTSHGNKSRCQAVPYSRYAYCDHKRSRIKENKCVKTMSAIKARSINCRWLFKSIASVKETIFTRTPAGNRRGCESRVDEQRSDPHREEGCLEDAENTRTREKILSDWRVRSSSTRVDNVESA